MHAVFAQALALDSSLVGFVTAPVHDPYFDLTIEGLKQTLLSITNMLHRAAEGGGAINMAAMIDLCARRNSSSRSLLTGRRRRYREDFLLKQRLDQFQALWRDKMDAQGIEDIQGRLWWTSHCGPVRTHRRRSRSS